MRGACRTPKPVISPIVASYGLCRLSACPLMNPASQTTPVQMDSCQASLSYDVSLARLDPVNIRVGEYIANAPASQPATSSQEYPCTWSIHAETWYSGMNRLSCDHR